MLKKLLKTQVKKQEKMLEKWLTKRELEHPFPFDKVEYISNVSYLSDDLDIHKMDIYYPKGNKEKLPVIINIHGGGFLLGKKEVNKLFCANLTLKGFIVFCVEYPLIPDCYIFDIFNDLVEVINNINEVAINYNGDINNLFLVGDSAGAYLAYYLSAFKNNEKIRKSFNVKEIIPSIQAIGLISGMFYTTKFDQIGMFLPKFIYGNKYKKSSFYPYINPENEELVRSISKPFLVTGKGDFLRHYSRNLVKSFDKHQIKYEFLDLVGEKSLPHAYVAMLPELKESQIAINKMIEFFKI